MPCLPGIVVPTPTLPSPFSAVPPVPPIPNLLPSLCCTLPKIPTPPPIPPIPPVIINQGIVTTLENGIQTILSWLDKIPLKCPKEL